MKNNLIRLNAFLSQSGVASRRKADRLIAEGKIKINDHTSSALGTKIDPEKDRVTFEGKIIKPKINFIYLALNKPIGYITTLKDERGRPCITDLIPPHLKTASLKPVGRLDKDTEGLLILTNDNDLIHKLTHPKFEKEKEYRVEIAHPLKKDQKEKLEKGIVIEDDNGPFKTHPCHIRPAPAKTPAKTQNQTEFYITLKEGRKRQIRKMFKQIGHTVIYLQRMRVGKLTLGRPPIQNLESGQSKLINKNAV